MTVNSHFRNTALALLEAEEAGNQAGQLRNGLLANGVDPGFLVDFVTICVGVIAFKGEVSPRTVYDQLFAGCPTDEDWGRLVEQWAERSDGDDG